IMLTGHLMQEPILSTQTLCIGDAMRCYPEFGLPGIDILADRHEYTTAKQAQSVVRQTGASGMLSELYGVTGWDYDFRGHKLQGDWQAALGVTVRVPHLTWMSMKGEAKRDYPACIGYQSPWWEKYGIIEDYFARLRVVLTQGKPIVRIAVLHPIESFWLHWGPADKTDHVRRTLDERFTHLTELLLFHLLDFDFVSEALIPELENDTGGIGEMKYQLLLIPACETLRSTTLDWLERFCGKGGKFVFIGACPKLIDGCGPETEGLRKTEGGQEKARNPTVWKKLERIYAGSSRIPFDDQAILQICQEERLVDVRSESGKRPEHFLYQLRQDRDCLWLFLARGKNPSSPDVEEEEKQTGMSDTYEERRITVILKGEYQAERFDALTGQTEEAGVWHDNGKTYVEYPVSMHDSFLLRLQPAVNMKLLSGEENFKEEKGSETGWEKDITRYFEKVNVFLEEPNACVLDLAEYALDDEAYSPMEEILRLDNICRRRAGIPERGRDVLQPYLVEKKPALHRVRLRFIVYSEIYLQGIRLAMEDVRLADIRLNGAAVKKQVDGWYVDRCIETVLLPAFEAGKNVLEISAPLGEQENLEWCYLTGDFGVKVEGTKKTLTAPVRNLTFGDIVTQGLPFYTGNLRYEFDYDAQGDFCIHVPQYRGALVSVEVDGKKQGEIIFSPYICQVKGLASGRHRVALTLYNTRQNGFGQLHHTPISFYQNPNSWRTAKDRWCYEYQFRRVGILTSPELYPDRD
ncbi:MAG: hypothetical protein K2G28_06885, partial [Acetatifactor sp.]|nr:hypothetical protein [Acetatifactor sp.]